MKGRIHRISTVGMDEATWKQKRLEGIGGSYAGVILGQNDYMRPLELFHLYLGTFQGQQQQSEQAFHGTNLEAYVADLWAAYDGSVEGMQANYRKGKKVQACRKVNAIISNSRFPHLNGNLDRDMLSNVAGKKGILEIKTIDKFAKDKYEGDMPPTYITQVQQYMLLYERDYAEIAMLTSGNQFSITAVERSEEKISEIISKTTEFWERVQVGREILHSDLSKEKKSELIAQVEPLPDGSDSCEKFLKARFRTPALGSVLKATEQHVEWALRYNEALQEEKKWSEQKTVYANLLRHSMGEAEIIDFYGNSKIAGKVTWRGEKTRKLLVNVYLAA